VLVEEEVEEVVEVVVVVEEVVVVVVVVLEVLVPQSLQTLRQMGGVEVEHGHSSYFHHRSEAQKSGVSLGAAQ